MAYWSSLLGRSDETVVPPPPPAPAEPASGSLFVTGWRPAIGWVCAASLAVYYLPRFVLGTVLWFRAGWAQGEVPPMPEMGIGDILGLVGALLGMSWLRTAEKKAGVAR